MAIEVVVIQRLFYQHSVNYLVSFLFVLSSQILGYGMAGIMRKFVIQPAAMVWPGNLPTCALFRILHKDNDKADRRMPRIRFFFLTFFLQFVWYWFPGYICPVLSLLSLLCYIDPINIVLSQVTGANGLGLGSIQLD